MSTRSTFGNPMEANIDRPLGPRVARYPSPALSMKPTHFCLDISTNQIRIAPKTSRLTQTKSINDFSRLFRIICFPHWFTFFHLSLYLYIFSLSLSLSLLMNDDSSCID